MGDLPFIDDGDRLKTTVRVFPHSPGMIGGLEMCRASPVQQQEGAQGAAMGLIREQRANRESVADPVLSRGAVNTDDSFHDALLGDRHGMCRGSHCESGTLRPVDVKFAISVLFCER